MKSKGNVKFWYKDSVYKVLGIRHIGARFLGTGATLVEGFGDRGDIGIEFLGIGTSLVEGFCR